MEKFVLKYIKSNEYGLIFKFNDYPIIVSNKDGKIYTAHQFSNYRPELEIIDRVITNAVTKMLVYYIQEALKEIEN